MNKHSIKLLLLLLLPFQIMAQVITADPPFPIDNQPVTLSFHADEGDGGLADFTGDIWAHTGVITNNSASGSDWKYVIAGWGENTNKAKLTRINANTYELVISPSIRDFYGVPQGEEIQKIAIVFRNNDGSKTGRDTGGNDIFTDVYKVGLNVNIESPVSGEIVNMNDIVPVVVNASNADLVKFYINNEFIGDYPADGFTYDFQAVNDGKTSFKVEAISADDLVSDSTYVFVRGEVSIEEIPVGMHDGVNYLSDNSVLLSLLAPGKEYAFAIGDFSNWEVNDEVFMKQTPDGERFWIQIDNLEADHSYIYQYYIDGELKVADVYGEQISDPWNDSYIEESVFPNMPEYPFGLTQGIASVFTTAQTPYEWNITDFQAPKVTDMVIYETLIRDISKEHTFQFLIDSIDYFKELGINVMELMPINEFEGNSSWGYNPSFYFAVDKYYGPKNKLKEFVDICHANGIAVVIDMVLNHSYGQNPQVQMYWDGANNQPAADNPWFNTKSPNQYFNWGNDYNHESAYTKAFVDDVNTFWLEEFKVDGFRFDFTKGFTNKPGDGWAYDASRITILQRMANAIWEVNENAYVIFEHLSDNSEEKVLANSGILLWGNMNERFKQANMGYHNDPNSSSDLSWSSYKKRNWNNPHVVSYMESHDEERQMVYNASWGNSSGAYNIKDPDISMRRIAMSTLFHTIVPGPKMYWQFEELGYDYSINWPSGTSGDRLTPKPPRWDYMERWRRNHLYSVTAALNTLKVEQDAWETTNFEIHLSGAIKTVSLMSEDMNVIAIGNFDVVAKDVSIQFPNGGVWYNYFDDLVIDLGNTTTWTANLDPGEYFLFTTVEFDNPQLGTGIHIEKNKSKQGLNIFPNPTNEILNILINDAKGAINIRVFDINGKQVKNDNTYSLIKQHQYELSVLNLPRGVYLLKVQTESSIMSTHFVKI